MDTNLNLLVVLPVLHPETSEKCLASIVAPKNSLGIPTSKILIVDNSTTGFAKQYVKDGFQYYRDPESHNLGVARAWNIGARKVVNEKIDYLVILSSSMLFGPLLHCDFAWQMNTFWGADVIEADGHSWHLVALHRSLFEKVGFFDENFYPAYFEQIDWCYRLRVNGLEGGWSRVWINAISQGSAMNIDKIDCPAQPLLDYYAQKWGGAKGEEKWVVPYGDKPIDYFEQNSIPSLANKYHLTRWW